MKDLPNILIVDDIPSNLTYLKIIMKGVDANMIEAESGNDALVHIKGKVLALAILDVQMPGMNGYELAAEINRIHPSQVPIIFLTAAFPDNNQIEAGYKSGAVDYIIKPLNRKILISKIQIFLQLFSQKQEIIESREELLRSELEIMKAKEELELLNHHLINVREEERARISLMIHDELGQAMTAMKMDLNWVKENAGNPKAQASSIGRMIATTNLVIKKVQSISAELHPKLLKDLGLTAAIEWYCKEQKERTGLDIKLRLEEPLLEDFNTNLSLFRILQEAMTNIIRHAKASVVQVHLKNLDDSLEMIIEDNGAGFDFNNIEINKSMGLFGMRERARYCGGTIRFSNALPKGTRLTILLPQVESNHKSNQ
jgi:signal transduction histidine kinase